MNDGLSTGPTGGGYDRAEGSSGQQGTATGQSASDLITEQVSQGAQNAAQMASQAAQGAAQQAQSFLDGQRTQVAGAIETIATSIENMSSELRNQGQGGIAGVTDTAATYVRDAAGYLQARDTGALVGDAENYARRNPMVFYGGAFLLGMAAVRFLKSSPARQNSDGSMGSSQNRSMPDGRYDMSSVPHAYQSTRNMPEVDVRPAPAWTESGDGTTY
jgi:hypothetical protein